MYNKIVSTYSPTKTPNYEPACLPKNLSKTLCTTIMKHKYVAKKIKCTLIQALRLCTGRTAQRGSRGIALVFHDHGTRRG
jgi:hypothetical protein